jgi:hypothetical protein
LNVAKLTFLGDGLWSAWVMTTYAHRYRRRRYAVRALALAAVLAVAAGGLAPAADAAPKTWDGSGTSPQN